LRFQYYPLVMAKRRAWLVLILLAAAALRLASLADVPPGLTHDEADHGLAAWGVVNGIRPVYFTVGYGREPLFDYSTAGLMTFLGPSYLAGRLTAVYFSLILVAATFAWARTAFDERIALLAAAGLAVSFWAVMTGRQALRSISLPALFTLASYFYWRALTLREEFGRTPGIKSRSFRSALSSPLAHFVAGGVLLGLTFYAYVPARIMWLIFPVFLLYLALSSRSLFARAWRGTLLMLLIAAAISLPLLLYLSANPTVEVRLNELSTPLVAISEGNSGPLLRNASGALRLLTIEGDGLWRYNIPGRPILQPIMALVFYLGLGLAIWWSVAGIFTRRSSAQQRPKTNAESDKEGTMWPVARHILKRHRHQSAASFFALVWLVAGLSPALVTGPDLGTTRAIGMQPVLYIFPALVLATVWAGRIIPDKVVAGLLILLFGVIFVRTARDYFFVWANEPEVRVQYETALVTATRYLNEHGHGPTAFSTTTPGRYHSPAAAQLTVTNPAVSMRWFNGKHSLLVPQDESSTLVFTGFAPLNPNLEEYFDATLQADLPLRASDLDRPLTFYWADGPALVADWNVGKDGGIQAPAGGASPVLFGEALELLGYDLQTPLVSPGGELRLATFWRVRAPLDEAVLFTHVLGPDGRVIAQADRLDVPGYFWVPGDVFIQLHQIDLPEATSPGEYPLIVGLYTQGDLQRRSVTAGGATAGDHFQLRPVSVGS
jgi:4-amino-4-deoxy-L-arabinose transferase-like glycosyltransferase